MAHANITELSDIEFRGKLQVAFKDYADELESLGNRWAFELELAAADARAAMEALRGKWWLVGLDVKAKARRCSKRLNRMQEMAHAMGKQGPKFYRAYEKNFLDR